HAGGRSGPRTERAGARWGAAEGGASGRGRRRCWGAPSPGISPPSFRTGIPPMRSPSADACSWRARGAIRRRRSAGFAAAWARAGTACARCGGPPAAWSPSPGPHGSGTTTLAKELSDRFAPTRIPVSRVYFGAQKPLLPTRRLSKSIRRRLRRQIPKVIKDVDRRGKLRGLAHILADKWLRYL